MLFPSLWKYLWFEMSLLFLPGNKTKLSITFLCHKITYNCLWAKKRKIFFFFFDVFLFPFLSLFNSLIRKWLNRQARIFRTFPLKTSLKLTRFYETFWLQWKDIFRWGKKSQIKSDLLQMQSNWYSYSNLS